MQVTELQNKLLTRRAVKQYDPEFKLSEAEILELLDAANKAPSAWNLQHWKFMVMHSDESKAQLLPIAFHQQQIVDASAVIVILGDKEANKNIDEICAPDIEKGRMTEEIKARIANQVNNAYENEHYAYEAAVMNSTFPAMQIMNFATLRDLGTCTIGGFNRTQLIETFKIDERYVPTMLITVGKATKTPRESDRRDVTSITSFH
ncbi:nitroreductase family protein [Macrococcus armenti]|uniref:nitroreductase family protein n=1 Tax=Macrococcus armenti TaxID=2875764 RepID=UPI001CC99EAD|nr:nitroreductase family protein [Macrococcus armenti]UBH12688.1 nitroreductase family protein [Macrococcus armenti]UBH21846.1 nitroreductase family protein [Macrococcus armenti]